MAKTTTPASTTTTHGKTTATTSEGPRPNSLTLRLSRVIKAPPERVYQCFLDPDAYAKWLPPHGFTGKVHTMEPKVGGAFRMSFSTINRNWTHAFGGTYKELVPNKRIVHTDRFEDPAMGEGEMTVTIELTKVEGGTRVDIVQAGIPNGPAADGAPVGWSQSLDNLAALCEQELPF
ncbi:MAG TPA: SRPBCC family protein [Candidatus Thermoplasmatota archaeon]|nr:SRPBCC family protein [Candidatus Thermoplasmatota archaeon]